MENFNPIKKEEPKRKFNISNVSNFIKSTLLSRILNNTSINKDLADRLYANRIIEEELISNNKSFKGFTPELPEGSKFINIHGTQYVQINGRVYYVREFSKSFDLVDNTYDFMPRPDDLYPSKEKLKYQKMFNVSDASEPINTDQFYTYDETKEPVDNWIIHNDLGAIQKSPHTGKNQTWWLKGAPYKGMTNRSLFDKPFGRHLFARQSALEESIGGPLDQHRELTGEITRKGHVDNGAITITPTSEEDLPNITGLQSLSYNPLTKSMERGIFHKTSEPYDTKTTYKYADANMDTAQQNDTGIENQPVTPTE